MLIGLIGLKGSGKDTLADYLKSQGYQFTKLKFARGIIEMLEKYFGVSPDEIEDPELKIRLNRFDNGKSIRDLMKFIGHNFRLFFRDIWVFYTLSKVSGDDIKLYIITDVRYPNEAKAIKNLGGILIDIYRDDLYQLEKQIVDQLGHNFISRLILKQINPGLAHESEWNYFFLETLADYHIDNTILEVGQKQINQIVNDTLSTRKEI